MLAWLILILITIVPVKIGAELFEAENKTIIHCGLAVSIGTILAFTIVIAIKGLFGLIVTYIAISVVYSKIFQLSFGKGLTFTLAVFVIQLGIVQGLTDFGLHLISPYISTST